MSLQLGRHHRAVHTHCVTSRLELGTGEGTAHTYICSLGGFLEEEVTL